MYLIINNSISNLYLYKEDKQYPVISLLGSSYSIRKWKHYSLGEVRTNQFRTKGLELTNRKRGKNKAMPTAT